MTTTAAPITRATFRTLSLQIAASTPPFSTPRAPIDEPTRETDVAARFAVRLDWHTPAVMVAVARAYAGFEPSDPVELALVVAGEPDAGHAEQAATLMQAVAHDHGAFARVQVVGIDELADLPVDAAVLKPATDVRAGMELLDVLAVMQIARDGLRSPAGG